MEIRWNKLKSKRLKQIRGISFEEILKERFVGFRLHPHRENQIYMLFEKKGIIWVVPFVQHEHGIFLKTLFPDRKFTKLYRRGELL
ncbi:MAG: toxin [Candidatus Omnitrophota bacterium]